MRLAKVSVVAVSLAALMSASCGSSDMSLGKLETSDAACSVLARIDESLHSIGRSLKEEGSEELGTPSIEGKIFRYPREATFVAEFRPDGEFFVNSMEPPYGVVDVQADELEGDAFTLYLTVGFVLNSEQQETAENTERLLNDSGDTWSFVDSGGPPTSQRAPYYWNEEAAVAMYILDYSEGGTAVLFAASESLESTSSIAEWKTDLSLTEIEEACGTPTGRA